MAKHESCGEPAVLIGAGQINTRQIAGGEVGQKGDRRTLGLDNPWQEILPQELKELTELDWELLQIMFNNLQDERAHAQLH